MDKVVRIHASSGTTGKPTVVGYTKLDIRTWADVCARSILRERRPAGDGKIYNAYGYGLFTGGLGIHYGAEKLGCVTIPISGGMTERQVKLIVDFEPDIITVTPSYMLAILDEFRAQKVDPRACSLKIGIFGAEPWTNAMRTEIENDFDMHAVDIYGLSEVMGPGVANECVETKDGLHVWEDHFYPEVIDPVTGAVLPEGDRGELVFTSLTKEAMPVIRYRTRDLTRLLPGTARSMRRMEKITGRSDDMMIVRGVNVFPTQIEELILRDERLAPHFVIELRRQDRLDEMTVKVEARAGADDATRAACNNAPRASDQGVDRCDGRGGNHAARCDRAFARQGEADYRSEAGRTTPTATPREKRASSSWLWFPRFREDERSQHFLTYMISSRRRPAMRLCTCVMNAMPNSGVARFTIGIDTNAAMKAPASITVPWCVVRRRLASSTE